METKKPTYQPTDFFFDVGFRSYDKDVKEKANQQAKNLKEKIDKINLDLHNQCIDPKKALEFKQAIITSIESEIREAKAKISSEKKDSEPQTRYMRQLKIYQDAINDAFEKSKDIPWKNIILGTKHQRIFKTSRITTQEANLDIHQKISAKDNARFPKRRGETFCVIHGKHFSKQTRRKTYSVFYDTQKSKDPIKKSSYLAEKDGSYLISVAGGDSEKAGSIAAKHAVQLMSAHTTAESLHDGLYGENSRNVEKNSRIPKLIKDQVSAKLDDKHKSSKIDHQITLTCARAFPAENGQFHLVGMNVSDNMVVAFDPQKSQFSTVSDAKQRINYDDSTLSDTLSVESLSTKDVTFNTLLPEGTLVLCLSKGVWESLPLKQEKQEIAHRSILKTEIDFNALLTYPAFQLPQDYTPNNLVQALTNCAISHTDLQRREKIAKAEQAKKQITQYKKDNKIREEGYSRKLVIDDDIRLNVQQLERDMEFTVGGEFTIVCTQLTNKKELQKISTPIKPLPPTNNAKPLKLKGPAIFFFVASAIAAGLIVGFKAFAPVEMYVAALPFLIGIFAIGALFTLILSGVAIAQSQKKPNYEKLNQTDEPKPVSEYVERNAREYVEGEAWDYDLPLSSEAPHVLDNQEEVDPRVAFGNVLGQLPTNPGGRPPTCNPSSGFDPQNK